MLKTRTGIYFVLELLKNSSISGVKLGHNYEKYVNYEIIKLNDEKRELNRKHLYDHSQ